ncbi:hypothetical protein DACRYDRAFT_20506 [Dacryopinax primogenitus]|uniref:Uncharacterized protein n=1 Tax=Dacryopinax primogenitus (strain DJM 731) TaxID=1858805 RepID=M5G9I6_DACPD|nr:uncharacterized protein DACRYDRAFT_20506 [Dacryopinax primogenitus]EJU04920.1 hypothetical protein DACRYDRAFT_20506 [Dacryopinax primogenitus]
MTAGDRGSAVFYPYLHTHPQVCRGLVVELKVLQIVQSHSSVSLAVPCPLAVILVSCPLTVDVALASR